MWRILAFVSGGLSVIGMIAVGFILCAVTDVPDDPFFPIPRYYDQDGNLEIAGTWVSRINKRDNVENISIVLCARHSMQCDIVEYYAFSPSELNMRSWTLQITSIDQERVSASGVEGCGELSLEWNRKTREVSFDRLVPDGDPSCYFASEEQLILKEATSTRWWYPIITS